MTDEPKRHVWPNVVVLLGVLPVLYVLGVGPAAWAWRRRIISRETYSAYYAPIVKAADAYGLFEWLYWYRSYWVEYEHPTGNIRPIACGAIVFLLCLCAVCIKSLLPPHIAALMAGRRRTNWPTVVFCLLLAIVLFVIATLPRVQK